MFLNAAWIATTAALPRKNGRAGALLLEALCQNLRAQRVAALPLARLSFHSGAVARLMA